MVLLRPSNGECRRKFSGRFVCTEAIRPGTGVGLTLQGHTERMESINCEAAEEEVNVI